MSRSVEIADCQILCALGDSESALIHLRDGTSKVSSKIAQEVKYPYFSIDDSERSLTVDEALGYLFKVIQPLLERLSLSAKELSQTAIFFGCASIDLSIAKLLEKSLDNDFAKSLKSERVGGGYYAKAVADRFGIHGVSFTYNTACTSSANALIDAATMLESGVIDHALVIGFEMYAPTTLEGFGVLQLLSQTSLKAFDKDRDGIVLGEAISAVMLNCSQDPTWSFLSAHSSCETHSVTGTSSDGIEISKVMKQALDKADIDSTEVTLVKAHGTGSVLNDTAELNAMRSVFGTNCTYLSLKPYIGHTLGGCALAELVLLMKSVDSGFVPKSLNYTSGDFDDMSALRETLFVDSGLFLLNFFGFGGNNTSFLIKKELL